MEKIELRDKLYKLYESAGIDEINGDGKMRATFEFDKLVDFIFQELDKAREEGFNDGVEKAVGIIQKELDELLLQRDGENYWVGDILRDCGYTVEKILPKNMKGYLVKLKTKEDGK